MLHVKKLSDIGPRGSTTPKEREAAEYAASVLRQARLEPKVEPFTSTVSGWRPFAVAALVALLTTVLFQFAPRGLSAALGVVLLAATVSVFLEMYFRPNLLKLVIGKGQSQNVWARLPVTGTATRRVILAAHIDTHRTPWVFTSPGRLKFFKTMTTLGVVAFIVAALALLVFSGTGWQWLKLLALVLVPVHLIVFALTWQPDTTPHTVGANDNATGVGVVLNLAERLAREPLANTEVLAVITGCEEVGSVGMQAFIDQHKGELEGALGISIDNVGGAGAGVCYTSVEGMVIPLKPSPLLFGLAEELRQENPQLNAYTLPYTTLHTDATCMLANGVPALSFVGLTPTGEIPNWHTVNDIFENVEAGPVEATEEFVWQLLRRLDGKP